jgi:Tfp pilus assembly protein PilX
MSVRNHKIFLGEESGVVLIITMSLMIMFSLLTLGMFDLLKSSTQISGNHKTDLQTVYIADAGVEDAINELRKDPTLADDADYDIASTSFADGTYTAKITNVDIDPPTPTFIREMDIESTGTLNGYSRTIKAHAKIIQLGALPGDYAVAITSWNLQ